MALIGVMVIEGNIGDIPVITQVQIGERRMELADPPVGIGRNTHPLKE